MFYNRRAIKTLGLVRIDKYCPKCGSLLDEDGKCTRCGMMTYEAKRMKGVKLTKRMKVLIPIVFLMAAFATIFALTKLMHGSYFESMNFADMERRYLLNVPQSYDSTMLVPLVIVLHGLSGTPRGIEAYTGFTAKSEAEGFIVTYPEGYGNSWNVQFGLGAAFTDNIDDVGFIRALIDSLQEKFAIDGNRVYVAGHSNGAMLAYRLAAELSDRIAAVAPVAGTIGGRAAFNSYLITIQEPTQPVSIIAFHGLRDNAVPYNGSQIYLSVDESVSFWVEHDECSEGPLIEVSEETIKKIYGGGVDGTEVVLYAFINGGHEWPSSATDEAWEFFESHPKKG